MNNLFRLLSMLTLTLCLVVANLQANTSGTVYVVLFMHNEDSALGDLNVPQTRNAYLQQRAGLIEFAQMIKSHNLTFCWQSDWKFLQGVLKYETPELMAATNGKNLVRFLKEDMGLTIDPHSHEKYGYNYADVAHLIDSLGVTPTAVIGGHIYDPYSPNFQNWERFRNVLQGTMYPWAQWKGDILMGSGTPNHTYDPEPSGIWRPKNKYEYWTDDPKGNVLCVGQYTGDVKGVQTLVKLYQDGKINPANILTLSIFAGQSFPPGAISEYENNTVNPLLEMVQRGEIKIVSFVELAEIWKTKYDSRAFIYNAPTSVTDTVTTFIPSETAGSTGLYVKIAIPKSNRYSGAGSPVVVHVAGGWEGIGLAIADKEWPLRDFIEIRFNFPGSGRLETMSGGAYDDRGELCIRALRDVACFALGSIPDKSGKYLHEYTGAITPLYDNVGLCGWSNGGNATITAAGAFGEQLANLAWIVNWESPVGDGMPNVETGSKTSTGAFVNPAYDPNTGNWMMNWLAFDNTIMLTENGQPTGWQGGFYFDANQNGQLDQGVDFKLTPMIYNGKAYYSERVAQAAETAHLPAGLIPTHIPSRAETEAYWQYRNAEKWVNSAVQKINRLMFIVEAAEVDHVQSAPDHPHVLIQYEGFRQAGIRFVRLNPDRSFVEKIAGRAMAQAVDNDAFVPINHQSIRLALQPTGPNGVSSYMGVAAALTELADRTRYSNLQPQFDQAVVTGVKTSVQPGCAALQGNYPNPFNPSTTISFSLLRPSHVTLTVYNELGRLVTILIDAALAEGQHRIVFDSNRIPGQTPASGHYFYRLMSDAGIWTGRMVLLK